MRHLNAHPSRPKQQKPRRQAMRPATPGPDTWERRPCRRPMRPATPPPEARFVQPPYVADLNPMRSTSDENGLSSSFFNQPEHLQAQAIETDSESSPSAAPQNTYLRRDLFVLAELATRYLMQMKLRTAQTLFEGLTAVAPNEPYFWMGLAATHDRRGDVPQAVQCYREAARLDPQEGRPEINLAELALTQGRPDRARSLLRSGRDKARRKDQADLARKATEILSTLRTI